MTTNQIGTDESEIDLLELARVLWRRAWLVVLSTILVAAMAFGYTYCLVTPLYTASALLYVNNSSFSVGSTSFSISASELSAAKTLVDTYGVILLSRTTLEEVIEVDNLDYTYEELYSMITTGAVNDTEIFEVTVTSDSPAEAESIANTIAGILPEKISNIVEGSDVRIVDYAVIPSHRTSPSYTKNTAVGGILGFVLAAAYIILRYLLDENIHTEDYLTQTYPNIPLLAVVPDMSESKGRDSSGGYYGRSPSREGQRPKTERPVRQAPPAKEAPKSEAPASRRSFLKKESDKKEDQGNG
jgi:capsular polysaccharide biosynthesis protein